MQLQCEACQLAEVTASIAEMAWASRDPRALLGLNLISGMVDMGRPNHFPGHISDPDDDANMC